MSELEKITSHGAIVRSHHLKEMSYFMSTGQRHDMYFR